MGWIAFVALFIFFDALLAWAMCVAAARADALNNRLDNEPDSTGVGGAAWVHDSRGDS